MKSLLKQKCNFLLLAWPFGIVIYILARNFKGIAENVFARGIYRAIGSVLTRLTGLIPFSLGELLLIAAAAAFAAWLVIALINIIRNRASIGRAVLAVRSLRGILIATGIVFACYMLNCGVNYYRCEFAEFSGLTIQKSTTRELFELCMELSDKTNAARDAAVAEAVKRHPEKATANVTEGLPAPYTSYLTERELAYAARDAIFKLGKSYDVLSGYYPVPKAVHFSRVMSEFNITGVYFPWTMEANVNVDVPDYSIGVTMCHELSHLRGFMREDEANFIGYLAAVNSDEPELVYSGCMLALILAGNRLYEDSEELYYILSETYSDGVCADFIDNSNYWKEFKDTVASNVGEKVNDTYLKANNQTDGTKSYDRMVDLLLAEKRAR